MVSIISLISNPEELKKMSQQAIQTADMYTVENMAENFVLGIERALDYKGC